MITKKYLELRYGDSIMLLFKGDEPFTATANDAPAGVLIERNGKIVCYECGFWFKSLHTHLRKMHKMTTLDFKLKYGLNRNVGLCSKETSRKHSEYMVNRMKNEVSQFSIKEVRELGHKANTVRKPTLQRKNHTNTCPEQIKYRLQLLTAKYGENFSESQAKEYDPKILDYAWRVHGGWNKMKKDFGIKVTEIGKNNLKQDADLIYDLRHYIKTYSSIPWIKDVRIYGFPHAKRTYRNHFCSLRKSFSLCGVESKNRQYSVLN